MSNETIAILENSLNILENSLNFLENLVKKIKEDKEEETSYDDILKKFIPFTNIDDDIFISAKPIKHTFTPFMSEQHTWNKIIGTYIGGNLYIIDNKNYVSVQYMTYHPEYDTIFHCHLDEIYSQVPKSLEQILEKNRVIYVHTEQSSDDIHFGITTLLLPV